MIRDIPAGGRPHAGGDGFHVACGDCDAACDPALHTLSGLYVQAT